MTGALPTLGQLAAPWLGAGLPHAVAVGMAGVRLEVRTDSAVLARCLADYFAEFPAPDKEADIVIHALCTDPPDLGLDYVVKEPDPGKTRIKEEYVDLADGRVVRKRLTGMVFLFGRGVNLCLGDCEANDNQVINFVNNRFIERMVDAGHLLLHAAGVGLQDGRAMRGLALAGFSGMGKSTLALQVMGLGACFVSNDRVLVGRENADLVMHGVAKMPRVNPGTVLANPDLARVIPPEDRARFEALDPDELWELEHKYDAFIDQCFGPGRFRLKSPLSGLVLLNWRRDGEEMKTGRVDLARRPDLLPAFTKRLGLFYRPESDYDDAVDEAAYLEMLDGCPVYEMTGKVDFSAAAEFCRQLLDGSQPS
jgi:HprK-related kinase B